MSPQPPTPQSPHRPRVRRSAGRRLAFTLAAAAVLGGVAAALFYPRYQLWQAQRDIRSGDPALAIAGMGELGSVAVHNPRFTAATAETFADLMADRSHGLHDALRNLAQEVSRKNKELPAAWIALLPDARDDAHFVALTRLILASGRFDERVPLAQRLRYESLRVGRSVGDDKADALSALRFYDPQAVRQDPYWPTLRGQVQALLGADHSPLVRAAALVTLTRLSGTVPTEVRAAPLPAEAEVAFELGLLLLTSPLDDPAAWRTWLTTGLANWTPVMPVPGSAPATAPASEPASQPAPPRDDLVWLAVRLAQAKLSAGADLPGPAQVAARPLADRRAIAAGLRFAPPPLLASFADVLLNHDTDPIVRARTALAFRYQPSPTARQPLLYLATHQITEPLSDEAWVADQPVRLAALAALAVNRDPAADDPLLFEYIRRLGERQQIGNEEITEVLVALRTLGTNPSSTTSRANLAVLQGMAYGAQGLWQVRREAARTWLLRTRVAATQPAAASAPGSSPAEDTARPASAATPADAYQDLFETLDYPDDETAPVAELKEQMLRLMAAFDAFDLQVFEPARLEAMLRSTSAGERGGAILAAAFGGPAPAPLLAALQRRQTFESDPLNRELLKVALAVQASPPALAAINDAYFLVNMPKPALYWATFAAGDTQPLERIFFGLEQPRTLLQIDCFGEVVQRYFPDLPDAPLAADFELRSFLYLVQRKWWVVRGPALRRDAATGQWRP